MKPKWKEFNTSILEKLLEEGQKHYNKVIETLKLISSEMPEYEKLLDQEGKLKILVAQIIGQIAVRKGSK